MKSQNLENQAFLGSVFLNIQPQFQACFEKMSHFYQKLFEIYFFNRTSAATNFVCLSFN